MAFTLHDPTDPRREVDLPATSPVPYDTLVAGSEVMTVDGVPVRVASVEHLITMKRSSGRAQDLADIEALSQLTSPPVVEDGEQHGH